MSTALSERSPVAANRRPPSPAAALSRPGAARRSTRAGCSTAGPSRSSTPSATASSCRWSISTSCRPSSSATRLWSADRRAPARFRRSDYLRGHGDALPLAEAARDLVAERTGSRPGGPGADARQPALLGRRLQPGLLLLPRRRGRSRRGDDRRGHEHALEGAPQLRAERRRRTDCGATSRSACTSRPFMPMEQRYEWSAGDPGERLSRDDPQPRAGPDRLRGRARPASVAR